MSYANSGNYVRLGESCQASMDTLLSNQKFLPVNDPVYRIVFTKTSRYPGPEYTGKREEDDGAKPTVQIPTKRPCCGSN